MVRLIERGVGGIVTNAPEEAVRIRRERAELTDFERQAARPRAICWVSTKGDDVTPPCASFDQPAGTKGRTKGLGRSPSCVIPLTHRLFPRSEENP